jgi:hypothetical protein
MKNKVHKILIIILLILPVILLFGSYGLYTWSLSLDGNLGYHLFYTPLNGLYKRNEERGFNRFVEEGRNLFDTCTKAPFPSNRNNQGEAKIADTQEVPSPPVEILPLFEGETLDILVIGDSLANSVGKRLEPMINEYNDMTCRVEGVISSNLIRLDYYDWLSEGPRITKENTPDCVLIFLGANTMQSFYLDGNYAPLFSDLWLTIYRQRATLLLEELQEQKVDIFWMDLPPMQKESYNKNIVYLNSVIDGVCTQEGVDRINYDTLLTDDKGSYVSEKVVEDRQILIRSDGIHFTLDGASYISAFLITKLREKYELPEIQLEENEGKEITEASNPQEIPL